MSPLSVEEHLDRILASVQPLAPRRMRLSEAFGCVLAEHIPAPFDVPPFASSAMDGFAVRAEDVASARPEAPVRLRVVSQALMGRPASGAVGQGEAILVPTGSVVPPGADSIIPVEQCTRESGELFVAAPVSPGGHIRPAGEDLRAGDLAVEPGAPLTAAELGVLAAVGVGEVNVVPPARVGILSTGDELVRPPGRLGAGQIYDSNAPMLAGQVREAEAEPVDLGRVADDPKALVDILDSAAANVDLFVCSGGVSVGGNDPVKRAFATAGEVCCLRVAMKPGGPQAFGFHGGKPFFGLPGNPLAAFVSFEVFVRPALRRMMARHAPRPVIDVTLASGGSYDDCVRFVPSRLVREGGHNVAYPCARRSNLLAGLAKADALVEVPAHTTTTAKVFKARLLAPSSRFS
jgi:molybdopterin molybdotransferase